VRVVVGTEHVHPGAQPCTDALCQGFEDRHDEADLAETMRSFSTQGEQNLYTF